MSKNKLVLLIGTLLGCIILGGLIYYVVVNNTPTKKVERLEKHVNDAKETSGYNACVKKVDESIKLQDRAKEDCMVAKLAEKGYKYDVHCIGGCGEYLNNDMTYSSEHPECNICAVKERYNAEVYATNDCADVGSNTTSLSLIDCIKLLESK